MLRNTWDGFQLFKWLKVLASIGFQCNLVRNKIQPHDILRLSILRMTSTYLSGVVTWILGPVAQRVLLANGEIVHTKYGVPIDIMCITRGRWRSDLFTIIYMILFNLSPFDLPMHPTYTQRCYVQIHAYIFQPVLLINEATSFSSLLKQHLSALEIKCNYVNGCILCPLSVMGALYPRRNSFAKSIAWACSSDESPSYKKELHKWSTTPLLLNYSSQLLYHEYYG